MSTNNILKNTSDKAIGQRITHLRLSSDDKQATLAKLLHIGQGALSNKESGARAFTFAELAIIAEHYNVDCNYLITGVRAEYAQISKDFGLTGHTIEVMRTMAATDDIIRDAGKDDSQEPAYPMYCGTINALCKSPLLPAFLGTLSQYLHAKETMDKWADDRDAYSAEVTAHSDYLQQHGYAVVPPAHVLDRYYYDLMNLLKLMLKDMGDNISEPAPETFDHLFVRLTNLK